MTDINYEEMKLKNQRSTYSSQYCPACDEYRDSSLFTNWTKYRDIPLCQICEEWIVYVTPTCQNCDYWEKCCKYKCYHCSRHENYECKGCDGNIHLEIEKHIREVKLSKIK